MQVQYKRMKLPALLILCLVTGLHSFSQSPVINQYAPPAFPDGNRVARLKAMAPQIDSLYQAYAAGNHVPGLVYAIVAEGQVIHTAAFGYSDVERKIAADSNSVFRIASMTKSFAGMAILMLRDKGKLQLDDPVRKYVPEIDSVTSLTDDTAPITIRQLLTHTAGFPQDDPWADRQLDITDKAFTDFLEKDVSLSNPPGIKYEYSNLGYTLLGTIINRVSGQHYETYIQENILDPLGMTSTYWEYTKLPDRRLAKGYRWANNHWQPQEILHSGAYGMMGGLLTSIHDFVKYMQLHMSAWPARSGGDTMLLKRSSLREMHFPGSMINLNTGFKTPDGHVCARASSYNFGLSWARDCKGIIQVSHTGGLPGYGSNWMFLPEYNLGVAAFTNHTYKGPALLNIQVLNTLLAATDLQPRQPVPSPILLQRQKELASLLPDWKQAENTGYFAVNFFNDFFIDTLREEARTLFEKAGKIIRVKEIIPENQLRGSFIIEGEHADIAVWFSLSPQNPALIQDYRIWERPKNSHFSKYRLKTIHTMEEYRALVKGDPDQELVALDSYIPGIQLDIRYATTNNFTGKQLYNQPGAFLRKPVAEALKNVQKELNKKGLGLKIYDAYRPYDVTVQFYELYRDSVFVASPFNGSRHNRGTTVDLSVINLKTGKELAMPTPFDDFTEKAHIDYRNLPAGVIKNRDLLKNIMHKHGFRVYADEWWHYDHQNWRKYPVMDIPFELL